MLGVASTAQREERDNKNGLHSEDYVARAMPYRLSTLDMTMIFLMVMFFINNPVEAVGGGAAAFTYWIIGTLVFFVPCLIATAQLGTMFPYEGSLYNWTYKALGEFWSVFVGVSFWAPGILGMISSAAIAVTFLQGLNSKWLAGPQAQGALIVLILVFSSILAIQRFGTLQQIVRVTMVLILVVIAFLGLAALFWLATGHAPATNFSQADNWSIHPSNYNLFSTVIFAYLGANVSMTLGGEVKDRKVISSHLLRGGLLVFAIYLIVTFALSVVLGPRATAIGPFSVITGIEHVFGKFVGNVAVVCVIAFFIIFTALLNSIFSRVLLATAIDRRVPISLGKLDVNRVPLNAIMLQTVIAVMFVAIFFVLPYLIDLGNSANLANEFFTVSLYARSMVWAVSSLFLFINLLVLLLRNPRGFHGKLIVPMPVLWACICIAPLACILSIVVALSYSPMPQLIPSTMWGYLVGGLTVLWFIGAAMGSYLASNEASWEDFNTEMK